MKKIEEIESETKSYYAHEGKRFGFHIVRGYAYEKWIAEDFHERFRKNLEDNLRAIPGDEPVKIIWRTKPEITQEKDDKMSWRYEAYSRLTTIPELPPVFWSRWESKEGEQVQRIFP